MKTLRMIITLMLLACSSALVARGQAATTSMNLFQKGSGFYSQKDYRNAAVYLQQALDLEKQKASLPRNNWRALVNDLATLYGLSGDPKRGREALEYGIAQDPTYPIFHYTSARAYAQAGDLDHTLQEIRSAFKYQANLIPGEPMPDPLSDEAFRQFRSNKRFQILMTYLYQGDPIAMTAYPAGGAEPSPELPASPAPATAQRQTSTKVPHGRKIFFLPFADFPKAQMEALAAYYRQKFEMAVEIMPAIQIPTSAVDYMRQQLIAEKLIEGMRDSLPQSARGSNAVLIGFTNLDIYLLSENWAFAFGLRDGNAGVAVVSTARMDLHYPGEPVDDARPEVRLRKVVTKDIGILCFNLPQSSNPRSVLYDSILGIQELDAVSDDF